MGILTPEFNQIPRDRHKELKYSHWEYWSSETIATTNLQTSTVVSNPYILHTEA
jgi:hypothetical protein